MSPTTESAFAEQLRANLHYDMADFRTVNHRTLRLGTERVEFPVESYYVATSIPRVEMTRAMDMDATIARVSMEMAGQLNNALIQHLVEGCSTDELMRYKRSIIDEIKKRNQGERREPDNN